jgi:hypothetical protein
MKPAKHIPTEETKEGNPAYPQINEDYNRYEYETTVEIDGNLEPIHGGKRRRENAA